MKPEKTNVMRVLDSKKIEYKTYSYEPDGTLTGGDIAQMLGQDPAHVFKTLVTVGKTGQHYVFVVPVMRELDLKKAASSVHEKNIEMVKSRELLPLTGYIHGGCSPVGMKKFFVTTVDISAQSFETIVFSAGKIGFQVELAPAELEKVIKLQYCDICEV